MAPEKITVRTDEAARMLGVSSIWLKKDRRMQNPAGPPSLKRGRMVLYRVRDLEAWVARDGK